MAIDPRGSNMRIRTRMVIIKNELRNEAHWTGWSIKNFGSRFKLSKYGYFMILPIVSGPNHVNFKTFWIDDLWSFWLFEVFHIDSPQTKTVNYVATTTFTPISNLRPDTFEIQLPLGRVEASEDRPQPLLESHRGSLRSQGKAMPLQLLEDLHGWMVWIGEGERTGKDRKLVKCGFNHPK